MYRKEITCIKIEHVRDMLNEERNLKRTSLARGKKGTYNQAN